MKVFSVYKFIACSVENSYELKNSLDAGWPQELDGKTLPEIQKTGYLTDKCWMVEPEDYVPYVEKPEKETQVLRFIDMDVDKENQSVTFQMFNHNSGEEMQIVLGFHDLRYIIRTLKPF